MALLSNNSISVSGIPCRLSASLCSPKRLRSIAAMWLFSAILLFGQAVDLGHNHDGDLQAQFDCDICLVTGSLVDALGANAIGLDFSRDSIAFQEGVTSNVSYLAVPRQARAPPIS